MPRLIYARFFPPLGLQLGWDDGTVGEIDLRPRLFGVMFEPLRDPSFAAQVFVDEYGAPTWPNGADLAPDALYREVKNER